MEVCLGMDEELLESLWVRIKGRAGTTDILGVCYRLPDQEDNVDGALYRQIRASSHSEALVLMGDFSYPICWRGNTAGQEQSRRFLECTDDNFLLQRIEQPTRTGAMLDLVLTSKEKVEGNVKLNDSIGFSDCKMVNFEILRAVRTE